MTVNKNKVDKMKLTKLTIFCAVFFFSLTPVAIAETVEEEIKKIEESNLLLDKKEENLQKRIRNAETEIRLLNLKLPKLQNDSGITGNIKFSQETVENIETQISAYRALEDIADKAQKEILSNLGSNVSLIVFDKKDELPFLDGHLEYLEYKNKINKLNQDYGGLGLLSPSSVATGIDFLFKTI